MSEELIQTHLASVASMYDDLITFEEAADIARVTVDTVYQWSCREGGRCFEGFSSRRGKRVLLCRDSFVRWLLSGPTTGSAQDDFVGDDSAAVAAR